MTLHNRFHFLNLWDEAADKREDDKLGPVREQQSVDSGASQWTSGSSGQGECCRSLLASATSTSTTRKRLKKLQVVAFYLNLLHPTGGSKYLRCVISPAGSSKYMRCVISPAGGSKYQATLSEFYICSGVVEQSCACVTRTLFVALQGVQT